MAKTKVDIKIKQDLLAELNKKDRDRLLGKEFKIKEKDYFFEYDKTVMVTDPSWTTKALSKALYYNVKRSMQIISARVFQELKEVDGTSGPAQAGKVAHLKKKLEKSANETRGLATRAMKQIVEEITQDTPKWDKARETKDTLKQIGSGETDLKKMIGKLETELDAARDKIGIAEGKTKQKKIQKLTADTDKKLTRLTAKKDDEIDELGDGKKIKKADEKKEYDKKKAKIERIYDDESADLLQIFEDGKEQVEKETKDEVKGYVGDAMSAFSSYRQDRKDFHDVLKTAQKMNRLIDKKHKGDDALNELTDMFKEMKKLAKDCESFLIENDSKIMKNLLPNFKTNTVTKSLIESSTPKLGDKKVQKFLKKALEAEKLMKKAKLK